MRDMIKIIYNMINLNNDTYKIVNNTNICLNFISVFISYFVIRCNYFISFDDHFHFMKLEKQSSTKTIKLILFVVNVEQNKILQKMKPSLLMVKLKLLIQTVKKLQTLYYQVIIRHYLEHL